MNPPTPTPCYTWPVFVSVLEVSEGVHSLRAPPAPLAQPPYGQRNVFRIGFVKCFHIIQNVYTFTLVQWRLSLRAQVAVGTFS